MATYHGNEGIVKTTDNKVAEVKEFSVQASAAVADDTAMGDEWSTHIENKTVKSWSGSISGNYDPTDAQGQVVLVEGASITLGLYPAGDSVGAKYISGKATIVQVSINQTKDGVVPFSLNFTGNGPMSRSAVAGGGA